MKVVCPNPASPKGEEDSRLGVPVYPQGRVLLFGFSRPCPVLLGFGVLCTDLRVTRSACVSCVFYPRIFHIPFVFQLFDGERPFTS